MARRDYSREHEAVLARRPSPIILYALLPEKEKEAVRRRLRRYYAAEKGKLTRRLLASKYRARKRAMSKGVGV